VTVKDLLVVMMKAKASDLYLTVDSSPMFRVEGVTRAYGDTKLTSHECEEIAMSLMNERQKAKFSETLEMNLGLYYPEIGRFRVNIFNQKGFVAIVFRQIKMQIETVDDLGLPTILKDLALTKRGLVLVVGGTGTGKSTTLAAMVEERNRTTNGHIITVEDPIEFMYPHRKCIVSQREIGIDTLTYTDALKNAMRQAPDVILIGEIRDRETMESAVTFSETGHLCLSTLHANNANQAIERIMNFFPSERHDQIYFQLSLNMRAIISQRLIPGVDAKRVAAIEIMLDTPRVKDLIMKRQIGLLKEAMAEGSKEGMQTFDQHIFEFFIEGKISYENAIVYADSANDLRLRIKIDDVSAASSKARESEADMQDEFRIKRDSNSPE
jgi:twitching motility protein PilU